MTKTTRTRTTRMLCITVDIADEIHIPPRRIRIPLLQDGVRHPLGQKGPLRLTIPLFGNRKALSRIPHTLLAPLEGENSVPRSLVHRKMCHTMTTLFRPYRVRLIGRGPDLQQGTFRICANHKVLSRIPHCTLLLLLDIRCSTLLLLLAIPYSTLPSLLEGENSVHGKVVHRKMRHTMTTHSRRYRVRLGQGLDLFYLQDGTLSVGSRVHQEEENQARNESYLSPKRNLAAHLCIRYLLLQRLHLQEESG